MTSKRPSALKNLRAQVICGNSWTSSKNSSVSPGSKRFDGSSSEMFLMMLATSYPSSQMRLYLGSSTKLISTMLP